MSLTPLINRDATESPLLTDFRKMGNRLIATFHDQPNIGRQFAPYVTPVAFDGINETETPTWEDIEDAEYAMTPGESHVELQGDSVITKMPQIYKSAERLIDHWKRMFAQKDRLPIVLTRLRQKVKNKEDIIIFQGDTKEGITGLIDGGHSITPTGLVAWGTDTGSNGILNVAQNAFKAFIDYFTGIGLGGRAIDFGLTFPAYNLLNTYDMYARDSNNMKLILDKINGGVIRASNNIQANVSLTSNTLVGMVRLPAEEAGWGLLSSGIEQEVYRSGLYTWVYGVREKFSVEIVDGNLIASLEGIDASPV